jgi:hypothetical protein
MTNERQGMEAIGGLVGVTQDKQTLALRPKIGWAVREPEGIDFLLLKLERDGHLMRPSALDVSRRDENVFPVEEKLPGEAASFYFKTDGAELFVRGEGARFSILPRAQVTHVGGHENTGEPNWYRICRLADGTELVIDICGDMGGPPRYEQTHRVCHVTHRRFLGSAKYTTVATSFEELLRRMLESGGRYWWLEKA